MKMYKAFNGLVEEHECIVEEVSLGETLTSVKRITYNSNGAVVTEYDWPFGAQRWLSTRKDALEWCKKKAHENIGRSIFEIKIQKAVIERLNREILEEKRNTNGTIKESLQGPTD